VNFGVKVSNAFSPNDDGKNDDYKPIINCTSNLNYTFRVFSRWGQVLFETNDQNQGWNGMYNGKPMPLGVYVYYIQYSCDNCSDLLKGNVTLLR
jgi:gliding motility-associated-like protein